MVEQMNTAQLNTDLETRDEVCKTEFQPATTKTSGPCLLRG